MKLIELLVNEIRASAQYNSNVQVAPSIILWTDKQRQWESALPLLQAAMPELIVLGDYQPERRTGPAVWVKCIIEGVLPEQQLPENLTPILYLPGIERRDLRAIATCPESLKPLAELQYRGCWWAYNNAGRDWTANAFLVSHNGGVGLDVAADDKTQQALLRVLSEVLESNIADLSNRRLEAADFNKLVSNDPVRDLLTWMNDPAAVKERWDEHRWQALVGICDSEYQFNPDKDGELAAAELLCARQGIWEAVWQRYVESWDLYPHLVSLLLRVTADLASDGTSYPQINQQDEAGLEADFNKLSELPAAEVRKQLIQLEKRHAERRQWLWCKQGLSPLAAVLEPLAVIAELTQTAFSGSTPVDMGQQYQEKYWQIDEACLKALAMPLNLNQQVQVQSILDVIYTSWLSEVTQNFQQLVAVQGYPGKDQLNEATTEYQPSGEVVFFIDGLRFDVAQRFLKKLQPLGETKLHATWSALPSVTATAKSAVTPVHKKLTGRSTDVDFEPSLLDKDVSFSAHYLKSLLKEQGWQYLADGESGDVAGNAWVQSGDIDSEGHIRGIKLAGRIDALLNEIIERTEELLAAGWKTIRYVTDHGWLLTPKPMEKVELAKHLTETRWGRCALVKSGVSTGYQEVGWHWNESVSIAMAPRVTCFKAGQHYDHGGLSLQECLTPVIKLVSSKPQIAKRSLSAELAEPRWAGLRCHVQAQLSEEATIYAVLRTQQADASSEICQRKSLKDGKCSLVVDDEHEGKSAVLVLLDDNETVLAKKSTLVGDE